MIEITKKAVTEIHVKEKIIVVEIKKLLKTSILTLRKKLLLM